MVAQVPFSSRRRWSALDLDDERLVLGAPELFAGTDPGLAEQASEEANAGWRVLALEWLHVVGRARLGGGRRQRRRAATSATRLNLTLRQIRSRQRALGRISGTARAAGGSWASRGPMTSPA